MYLFVVITTDLMLLPLQGVFCMSLLPRVSLRFAQGYELAALSERLLPLLTLLYDVMLANQRCLYLCFLFLLTRYTILCP